MELPRSTRIDAVDLECFHERWGMLVESERGLQGQPPNDSEQCLLLVRAPSDVEIYSAFRALALRWRDRAFGERLLIEGDVPLTAQLAAPAVPATLQRLLDADCEMIDLLEIEAGELRVAYLRSGGHAPFRESFFDELRVQVNGDPTAILAELEAMFEILLDRLSVASYSAISPFAEILTELTAKRRGKAETPHQERPQSISRPR